MANAADSKSVEQKLLWVRLPPRPSLPGMFPEEQTKNSFRRRTMRKKSFTQCFKGMMWAAISPSSSGGSSDGTRRFSSQAPTTKLSSQATAKVGQTPMAIEIDSFIAEMSRGKKGFGHETTFMKTEDDNVAAIVICSWDEPEIAETPFAPSALPQQAAQLAALPVAPVATPRQASTVPQVRQ